MTFNLPEATLDLGSLLTVASYDLTSSSLYYSLSNNSLGSL